MFFTLRVSTNLNFAVKVIKNIGKIQSYRFAAFFMLFMFLMMQGAVALHVSEYGPLDHKHGTQSCEFCLFSKDAGNSAPPSYVSVDITFPEAKITYSAPPAGVAGLFRISGNFARAPPTILQS